ncbi:MAG: hypothetical protein H7331_05855 [Bacteroidia bacterium]|nr:hypothetical protein [Bacteroidia bacterium]
MKKRIPLLLTWLTLSVTCAHAQDSLQANKQAYYSAYAQLNAMLQSTDSASYEQAVFITENAYYNNAYSYSDFIAVMDKHVLIIQAIATDILAQQQQKIATMPSYQQRMARLNALNSALYMYLTDTVTLQGLYATRYHMPYAYAVTDPYGTANIAHTQVLHLLSGGAGNCYAINVLHQLLSNRLHSQARIVVAPHHIYTQVPNSIGDYYNVELATRAFPGDGTIQTLTYTSTNLIMNGLAQREITHNQAIALNLIYLAKGYAHKYNAPTDVFVSQCAQLALLYDSLNLNAMLLQASVAQQQLEQAMQQHKLSTLAQARTHSVTKQQLKHYEQHLAKLYTQATVPYLTMCKL